MSSTGDIKNNLSKLLREIKRMDLKVEPNIRGLLLGIPSAFLPILHGALMSYSLPLAQHLSSLGVDIYGRSDLRFVEGLYKVMRDVFQYRPKISKEQFLAVGFAECKVILTYDVMKVCQSKHTELSGPLLRKYTTKSSYSKATPTVSSSSATVHTIASSQGIGSVWLEKPLRGQSTDLPLSPPASPLQSPLASEGPTITPEPRLELTPNSTPLKNKVLLSSKQVSDHTPHLTEKDVHISELEMESNVEIVTVRSEDTLDWSSTGNGNKELDIEIESASVEHLSQSLTSAPSLGSISSRIEELLKMMDRLMGRMTLVETQVKILQDRGVVKSNEPIVMQDSGIQTDLIEEAHPRLASDPPVGTSPVEGGNPLSSTDRNACECSLPPLHLSCVASPPTNSTPQLNLQRRINFDNPGSGDVTPLTRTPAETKKILNNLRTRAQQTRELLSRANHTSSMTDSLLQPVN